MTEVLLIFDVGKTNKKVLLFDKNLSLVHEEESRFEEVKDEEGFPADDAQRIEDWVLGTIKMYMSSSHFRVKGINFTAYGASLVYLDEQGKRLTPIYNYLKPMPEEVLDGFYESYGGVGEFSRKTASPALGMLNSGLQLLWLKRMQPEVFRRVKHILHLPQYLSYLATREITSELTSIGCHTAMWDFDTMQYHHWLEAEGISLPVPEGVSGTYEMQVGEEILEAGIGIHDSSSSLAPYILASKEPFILISTGTWCITMNPFNHESLSAEELEQDCLCFLSVKQSPVKSSRFFLGRIHDLNTSHLESYFGAESGAYKALCPGPGEIKELWDDRSRNSAFFKEGVPDGLVDDTAGLAQFHSFQEAYSRLMLDLTLLVVKSVELTIAIQDRTKHMYISGGFARNPFFTGLMALAFPGKTIYTSQVDNASSLGAALVISEKVWPGSPLAPDLGLVRVDC